jgi:hypothetical protein
MYNKRSTTSGLSGAIVLLGLILAFVFAGPGGFNLVIFFIALGLAILAGSLATRNVMVIYGSIMGSMWMLILALFFATDKYWDHAWLWFLVGAFLSIILGSLNRPITALLMGIGIPGTTARQQPQQPYQPSQPQPATYQEGGQQHPYPSTPPAQYEQQPQARYPEQMPPQ